MELFWWFRRGRVRLEERGGLFLLLTDPIRSNGSCVPRTMGYTETGIGER